ncbi:hypothetical protein L4C54_01045 [Vibrio lamellibrachiae]|uniref:hypothetical protein n=1 Tax=Vibrio lamellibrachiae TaxID=2910253 RepID=UPI003D0B444D
MDSVVFGALSSWGLSPQFVALATIMVVNIRNQKLIITELSKGLRGVSDRVLVLETKDAQSNKSRTFTK